jgi:hypothetical protein
MRCLAADKDPDTVPLPSTNLVGFARQPDVIHELDCGRPWANQVLRHVLATWIANRGPPPPGATQVVTILEDDADLDQALVTPNTILICCLDPATLPGLEDVPQPAYAKYQRARAVWVSDFKLYLHLIRAYGVDHTRVSLVPWLFLCHVGTGL